MRPSEETSTQALFPLTMTSPTRAVMAAFRSHRPTSFDLSPSTHHTEDLPWLSVPNPTTPSPSPRQRHIRDWDPKDFTPHKRMRLFTTSLASTASGSYLVAKTPTIDNVPSNREAPFAPGHQLGCVGCK